MEMIIHMQPIKVTDTLHGIRKNHLNMTPTNQMQVSLTDINWYLQFVLANKFQPDNCSGRKHCVTSSSKNRLNFEKLQNFSFEPKLSFLKEKSQKG